MCWCRPDGGSDTESCGMVGCTPEAAFDNAIARMSPSYHQHALLALRAMIGPLTDPDRFVDRVMDLDAIVQKQRSPVLDMLQSTWRVEGDVATFDGPQGQMTLERDSAFDGYLTVRWNGEAASFPLDVVRKLIEAK